MLVMVIQDEKHKSHNSVNGHQNSLKVLKCQIMVYSVFTEG